jgi:hypothetical protein
MVKFKVTEESGAHESVCGGLLDDFRSATKYAGSLNTAVRKYTTDYWLAGWWHVADRTSFFSF